MGQDSVPHEEEESSVELGTEVICWANVGIIMMTGAAGVGAVRIDKHLLCVGGSQLIFQHPQYNISRKKSSCQHIFIIE